MKKIPLVMKTWAGDAAHDLDYITRSIPSLLASRLAPEVDVVIYDDCSTNPELARFLKDVARNDRRVRIIQGEENKGPNRGQADLYRQLVAEYPDAPYYLNVDDDVVYHRDWLTHLLTARAHCEALGLRGVFTALNMPYRPPHAELRVGDQRLLVKWKQPALNWLIPRELYADVGPFRDEGIAYDTVYSHWMRLKHYAVICLAPSYVQNIGLLGAYATDDTTTSCDFMGAGLGEPAWTRWSHAAHYRTRRLPALTRRLLDPAARQIAPVRWGTEFVHEGRARSGDSVAMFSFEDAVRLGWDKTAAGRRVREVQQADAVGASAIRALRLDRAGQPVWVECDWEFGPNLRELKVLREGTMAPGARRPGGAVSPEAVFRTCLVQLMPLHEKRVVHNKIRQDNLYLIADGQLRLAWFGTEPCPGVDLLEEARRDPTRLSGALNRWAGPAIRSACAARYLESQAPEVLRGAAPTTQSDLFAAAAVALLSTLPAPETVAELERLRDQWATDTTAALSGVACLRTRAAMTQCLAIDPAARPRDARAAAALLAA